MANVEEMGRRAQAQSAMMIEQLRDLVEQESPPGALLQLHSCAELLDAWGTVVLGRRPRRIVRDGLPHLLWSADDQRVLLLGHYDTVWPAGTIEHWPFTV